MSKTNGFTEWELAWGAPRGLFVKSEGRKVEIAFLVALAFHTLFFGLFWQRQLSQQEERTVTLQNVDLIDPEVEQPLPAPPVVIKKPKSALEFLKMALPIFRKPEPVPKDLMEMPKMEESKIAEPEKLIEKKMPNAPSAPEIKLNENKNMSAPKLMELARQPQSRRAAEPLSRGPALKLEEVGKKAVALPQTPAISLNRSRRKDVALDLASIPKSKLTPQSFNTPDRLVEKTVQSFRNRTPQRTVLGYKRRGKSSLSLDRPREVTRRTPKPQAAALTPHRANNQEPATIKISKERVKITGQLKNRKVIKSFVPDYPSWARVRNIEAAVAIRFTVSPAGIVRPNTVVQRTSGYPALDKLAKEALKKWRFTKIDQNQADQWGIITFRFLLD